LKLKFYEKWQNSVLQATMQTINNYIYKTLHYNTSSVVQVLQGEWIITVQITDIKIKINSKTFYQVEYCSNVYWHIDLYQAKSVRDEIPERALVRVLQTEPPCSRPLITIAFLLFVQSKQST